MKTIKRTLYFYELRIVFNDDYMSHDGDKIKALLTTLMEASLKRENDRYQVYGERNVCIQSISFDQDIKAINGKLRCIRKDILPELMSTKTDEAKGIEAAADEGLVETTHFRIDYSKTHPLLCIEYNQFGSKIGDFTSYIQTLGRNRKILKSVAYIACVKNELKNFKNRMGALSEFVVNVHKDNIPAIKNIDEGVWSMMQASVDHFESEYADIRLKFDYVKHKNQKKMKSTISNFISKLSQNKNAIYLFNKLQVKAQDVEKANLLEVFDLLIDKVKSEVRVERNERHRTIKTDDIVSKMKIEITKKFNNTK